jgi:hypothetical protein
MIEAIFAAIFAHYSESLLPALVEGFFLFRAPQGIKGNYAIFFPVSITPDYDMSSKLENPVIQFSVCTDDAEANEGPTTAIRTAEMFMAVFDDCKLSIDGGTLIRIDRQSHNLLPDPDGGYMYQIDYRLQVQEV